MRHSQPKRPFARGPIASQRGQGTAPEPKNPEEKKRQAAVRFSQRRVGCRLLLQLWNQLKRSAQSLVFAPPSLALFAERFDDISGQRVKRSCGCFRRGWAGTTGNVNYSGHSSSCSLCRDSPPKSSTASRALAWSLSQANSRFAVDPLLTVLRVTKSAA